MPMQQTVDGVADSATQNTGQCKTEQLLRGVGAQQVEDEDRGRCRNRGEKPALPAGGTREEEKAAPLLWTRTRLKR